MSMENARRPSEAVDRAASRLLELLATTTVGEWLQGDDPDLSVLGERRNAELVMAIGETATT
jgi:hypothetical protein